MRLSFLKAAVAACVIMTFAAPSFVAAQDETVENNGGMSMEAVPAADALMVEPEVEAQVEVQAEIQADQEVAPIAAQISVESGFAYESGSASNGAVYLSLTNNGGAADSLVSATADFAGSVELHTTTIEADVAQMRPIEKIEVLPGATVSLNPQADHIMLIGLTEPLTAGDVKTITLNFASGATAQAEITVMSPSAATDADHDHGDGTHSHE